MSETSPTMSQETDQANDFSLGKVEVSLTPPERFEEFLQSRGKRITQQRRIIVEQVFLQHDHFDAEGLLAHLMRVLPRGKVSRPTVYRTLTELVDAGLLRKMDLGGRAIYEHDYGYPQHDHLYCEQCDKLVEFHSEEVTRIRDAVARENMFRVTSHRLIINGICHDCRQSRQRKRRLDLV